MAIAAVTLVTTNGKPMLSAGERMADGIRDGFRGPASLRADNARERIPDRGFWDDDDPPRLIDESLDYIGAGTDVDAGQVQDYSLERAVHEGFALRGKPIRIVAQVVERDATDEPGDGITTELRLVGRGDRSVEVRAGLGAGAYTNAEAGNIVVVHGLVIAKGDIEQTGERERTGVYIYVTGITQRHAWNDIARCKLRPMHPSTSLG